MKLNKIATAVSISLAALALTACGSDKKASNPSTPAPGGKPDTSVNNNEVAIKALVEAARAAGLTQANAEAFAKAHPTLVVGSPAFKTELQKALDAQKTANANNGNNASSSNDPVSEVIDKKNPLVHGYDAEKNSSVSADHYARQGDSNFDRTANPEKNGNSGLSTSISTNEQNPYLSNFVLGSESFSSTNGKPNRDAVDYIGRVVYADGELQDFDDAVKEGAHFDYTVESYNKGQRKIKNSNATSTKKADWANDFAILQYVNQSNVEIGEIRAAGEVAKVTRQRDIQTDLKDLSEHQVISDVAQQRVAKITQIQLFDEDEKNVTLDQLKQRTGVNKITNFTEVEDFVKKEQKKVGTVYGKAHSDIVLTAVSSYDTSSKASVGAKLAGDKDAGITLKTSVNYRVNPMAGAKSGLVAYNTKSSLPVYGVEENAYKVGANGKLTVNNPDSGTDDITNSPYRSVDRWTSGNKGRLTGDDLKKFPAVANNFTTRIFGKNYRALENGKEIKVENTSNNSYVATYGSNGVANTLTEMKLHNVQYGRITTNIDALAKDPDATKLDYISRLYEQHGAPTTVDKYFYRGTNETSPAQMKSVVEAAKGGKLEYRGHALAYNLGPLPSDSGRTELPTAFGSKRVATIGNFVQATYDTKTGKIEGSVYNLRNNDVRSNGELSGYKKQDLATFSGDVIGNTAIGKANKVGVAGDGSFTASFYGSNAEELGGQINSVDLKDGFGSPKWGAVFGASKIGAGGVNYDTAAVNNTNAK